jgi:hypothetical protein
VTTAVLAMSVLTSSTGAASVLPRLQGMVATLRFASRCTAAKGSTATAGGSAGGGDGSDDSNGGYAAQDRSDNVLMLRLPIAASLAYASGALLGNTVLVVGIGLLSHLNSIAGRWAQRQREQNADHGGRMYFAAIASLCCRVLPSTPVPAALMQLQGLLLQPTIAAAIACLVSSDRGAVSVVLAVVIGGTWLAVPCGFVWLLCVRHTPLPLTTTFVRRADGKRMRWERVGRALEWLCSEREVWVASGRGATAKAAARDVKRRLGAVFEGYRGGRHWYFGVDALLSALTGAVVGAAEAVEAADACDAAVWATACVGAFAALAAVLCVVLRPHVVLFELVTAASVSLLAVLGAALVLADDVNAGAAVSLAAAAAELLPLGARLLWNTCLRPREPSAARHVDVDLSSTPTARRATHVVRGAGGRRSQAYHTAANLQ